MHRVARLERGDARPAEPHEFGARLTGRHEQRAVSRLEAAVRQHVERSGQVHLALLHHHAHAGMLFIGRAKHQFAFERLVDRVLLGDAHRGERLGIIVSDKRDAVADSNRFRGGRIDRQRDRNRPEDARPRPIIATDAFPVGAAHEAVERRKAADAKHDDVALLARADGDFAQRCGACALGDKRIAFKHQRFQRTSAVRRYEIGHAVQPASLALRAKGGTRAPASHARANCRNVATTLEWNRSFG